jgi:hypothetical protein
VVTRNHVRELKEVRSGIDYKRETCALETVLNFNVGIETQFYPYALQKRELTGLYTRHGPP